MKKINLNFKLFAMATALLISCGNVFAGNEDRVGQAGATQLLINPWARSSGWAGASVANSKGLEAMFLNVAGIAYTKKTELLFCRTNYLSGFSNNSNGADIHINSFGFTQRVGETGALGLSIMSMDMGKILITTVENPEGSGAFYSPQFVNLGLSYAKGFSDNIYGGITLKIISEKTSNVAAKGVALDAGIQYVTGPRENVHFGISLKNWGPRMVFEGDGLSFRTRLPKDPNGSGTMTVEQRTAEFELPSLLNIGGAYDFYISKDSVNKQLHRLTVAGAFVSNSFDKNQFKGGLEYSFKSVFMVRGGYSYEKGITSKEDRTNVYTGPTTGFTFEVPFGKNTKSTFGLDYSYVFTDKFSGTHLLGARINL